MDYNKNQNQNQNPDPEPGRFVIVNSMDRPCERLIAEIRPDGQAYYIHPYYRAAWKDRPLPTDRSTPLEAFGVVWRIADGVFHWYRGDWAGATYPDGSPRAWQDDCAWGHFPYAPRLPGERGWPDLLEILRQTLTVGQNLIEDWEAQFGEGACDCRPEPENFGHTCNLCQMRLLIDQFKALPDETPVSAPVL